MNLPLDFKTIIYGSRDGIAKITINRPERMNGYNETMVKEMCAAIDLARQDDEVRVLIVTGSGRAFCAGGDIGGAPESRSALMGVDGPVVRDARRFASVGDIAASFRQARHRRD